MFAMSSLSLVVTSLVLAAPAHAQDPSSPKTTVPAVAPAHADGTAAMGANEASGAVKGAKVEFVEPKDGATVPKTFPLKFKVEGLKVAPAGTIQPGTGHFHLIVDAPALKEGDVIPADATHIHYGKGQTETTLTLAPGEHTLTLQFADGAHRAYNAMLTKTIHVRVK